MGRETEVESGEKEREVEGEAEEVQQQRLGMERDAIAEVAMAIAEGCKSGREGERARRLLRWRLSVLPQAPALVGALVVVGVGVVDESVILACPRVVNAVASLGGGSSHGST